MKHHPHHEKYDVLTATQAKMAEGEGPDSPGYTAGRLASQVMQAMLHLEFRPWMRIECVDVRADDHDDFAYAISYTPPHEHNPFVPYRNQRGINRFR